MKDLSPQARQLIERSKACFDCSDADTARLKTRVMAGVALAVTGSATSVAAATTTLAGSSAASVGASGAAAAGAATAAASGAAATGLVGKALLVVCAAGAIGTGGYVAQSSWRKGEPTPRTEAALIAERSETPEPAAPAVQPTIEALDTESVDEAIVPATKPQQPSKPARRLTEEIEPATEPTPVAPAEPSADEQAPELLRDSGLTAELAYLRTAREHMAAGAARDAIETLRRYSRHYPGGQLAPEAQALLFDALCAAGSDEAARITAERFADRWPGTPLASRLTAGCPAEKGSR